MALCVIVALLAIGGPCLGAELPRRPNIVFILLDDLGWRDVGCYGNSFVQTPHIDRLAAGGMRFTRAYSQPVCSPTRAALMTGMHPVRTGITDYLGPKDRKFLSPDLATLPKKLKESGYATGLIGKWHLMGDYALRRGDPARCGFDEVICSETSYIGPGYYFHPYKHLAGLPRRLPDEYLTDRLNLEAVEFLRRRRQGPFFLYLSHYAVHTTLAARPALVEKYRKKPGAGEPAPAGPARNHRNNPILAAMMESVDEGAGMIRRELASLGLDRNTLIVFLSDNGGEAVHSRGLGVTSVAPLRAGKSWLYEGGLRVPMIVLWPGVVRAGAVCDVPVNCLDLYPTFLEAAGARPDPDQPLDGVSLLPLLTQTGEPKRDAMYWHYPLAKPHFLGGRSAGAILVGDWKLLEFFDTGQRELYDLSRDAGEQHDLAARMPDKTRDLAARLQSWRTRTGARY